MDREIFLYESFKYEKLSRRKAVQLALARAFNRMFIILQHFLFF